MSTPRDIPGALGGSRLVTLPHVAPQAEALRAFLDGPGPALLEVGFDHGRRLLSTAAANPEWRVVGLEIRRHRVDRAREIAERHGVANLLVWRFDARIVLAGVLPEASLDVVEVLFPDPWWNAAHRRKRLLVDDAFLGDVARALRPGGLLHLATDVERYADHIAGCLERCAGLERLSLEAGAERRPPCQQLSRREWKCDREGIPVRRFYATAAAPPGG